MAVAVKFGGGGGKDGDRGGQERKRPQRVVEISRLYLKEPVRGSVLRKLLDARLPRLTFKPCCDCCSQGAQVSSVVLAIVVI